MKIARSIIYLCMIILVLIAGGSFLLKGVGSITGNIALWSSESGNVEAQRVVLSQEGFNYKDIKAKAGRPILISADSSVRGCLRSVTFEINGERYSRVLETSEDTLELPALPKGIYTFSCSMGMSFGKLIIV